MIGLIGCPISMRFEFSEITLPPIPNRLEGPRFDKFKRDMSTVMFTQRLQTFEDQASPEGPWKPLSQIQQEKREQKLERVSAARQAQLSMKGFAHVKLLMDKGILRQSFTPETGPGSAYKHTEIGEDFVQISTNLKYAAIQNFGGTIVPVKAKALSFVTAGGQRVFAKKVTIPARPFNEFTDAQEDEFAEVTEKYLNGEL